MICIAFERKNFHAESPRGAASQGLGAQPPKVQGMQGVQPAGMQRDLGGRSLQGNPR